MNRMIVMLSCGLCFIAGHSTAQDRDVIEIGQRLLQTYQDAVIYIKATVKLNFTGGPAAQQQERRVEVLATIIDPAGLAVTSLSSLDPAAAGQNLKLNRGGETITVTVKSEISDVQYRLADGREVAGRIVLRDEDLDLAFIAPASPLSEKDSPALTAVPLADVAADLDLLEPVISIGRTGKRLNYEPTITATRLSAKLSKPRVEYLAGGVVGGPSFTREGKLLGIGLLHRFSTTDRDSGNPRELESVPVVIPASAIAEIAVQAREEVSKASPELMPAASQPATEATVK